MHDATPQPAHAALRAGRTPIARFFVAAALVALTACGSSSRPTPAWEGSRAVVSAHHAATEAGMEILEAGGSAADAAVAVAAALSVVEPWFSSVLGGGTWALYYDAEAHGVTSLDGVGPVGSRASVEDFAQRASDPGIHQAIVPGSWDGWMLWLERYGRLSLGEVLAPAIEVAREGYPVSQSMARWLRRDAGTILERPDTAAIYAPDGEVLDYGDTVHQHDLADTFAELAAAYDANVGQGRAAAIQAARDHVYRGPVAEAIVEVSDEAGGYLTLDDFASFEAEIVEPVAIDYGRAVTVYQNPPNSQGITMLLALNVLDGFDLASMGPNDPDAVHLQLEALKLAFADRHYHVGDPARVDVPVAELLSDAHATRQRQRISMDEALTWPIEDVLAPTASVAPTEPAAPPPRDRPTGTTTFHVVDADGNAAAVTTSLGAQFYVMGDTGVHINNRMRFVALAEGDPNRLTPGAKVRHTSNPYMALRGGHPYVLGGNTGADTQVQGQLQQFVGVVDFGMTAQEAVGRPRFLTTAFPATTYPYQVGNSVQVEFGVPEVIVDALRSRGHTVRVGPGIYGTANMLVLDDDGIAYGADPRSGTTSGIIETPER